MLDANLKSQYQNQTYMSVNVLLCLYILYRLLMFCFVCILSTVNVWDYLADFTATPHRHC